MTIWSARATGNPKPMRERPKTKPLQATNEPKRKAHPAKRWFLPLLMMISVVTIALTWISTSDMALSLDTSELDLSFLQANHHAESDVVIVPPPQTDLVNPPEVNLPATASQLNSPKSIDRLKRQAWEVFQNSMAPADNKDKEASELESSEIQASDLAQYQIQWAASPEAYTLTAKVNGPNPHLVVAMAETAAQSALTDYHRQLHLPSSKLSPFLNKRIQNTSKQLNDTKTKLAQLKEGAPQTKAFLQNTLRHLEHEKELLEAMAQTQVDMSTEQQQLWKQYARIKTHGHLVQEAASGLGNLIPALGLLCLCLVGVWLLKEERLSPDTLMESAQLLPIPPKQPIEREDHDKKKPKTPFHRSSPNADSRLDKAMFEETQALTNEEPGPALSSAAEDSVEGSISEEAQAGSAPQLTPITFQSPFLYGNKLLKMFNNPVIQQSFTQLLKTLHDTDMPSIVGVINSAELASALSLAMSTQKQPVTLIDLDLQNPAIHRIFDVENDWGITHLLNDPLGPAEALAPPSEESPLVVIPAGPSTQEEEQALYFEHLPSIIQPFLNTQAHRVILNLPSLADTALFERCLTQSGCQGLLVVSTHNQDVTPIQQSFLMAMHANPSPVSWLQVVQWDILLES